ncbi:MAG: hypothetical protein DRH34_01650 [Deltaproteobacteria bacterium]|nr:MAG: hypothetical protein DRH34_01650 [Deltaproteobacteria bacterium]
MNKKKGQSFKIQWHPKIESTENDYRVLLAEDDLEMRKMLAWSLREEGFDVTECKDGNSLMKRLGFLDTLGETETFDLIISDIRMPGVTGTQVLEAIKDYEDFPPMILITAFGDEVTHIRAKKLGAVVVIDKPFDIDDLFTTIAQVIPFKQSSTDLQRLLFRERGSTVQFPMNIIFRHGCGSGHARSFIQEQASKLNRFDSFIQRCHVMVDQPTSEKQLKHRCLVTATVSCTRKTLVATHNSGKDNGHENLYLAIQIVFDKLYRQVKNYHKKLNSSKFHSSITQGEQIR